MMRNELKKLGGERIKEDPWFATKLWTGLALWWTVLATLLGAGTLTPVLLSLTFLWLGIGWSIRDSYYSDEDTIIPQQLKNANTHKDAYLQFLNTVPWPNWDASYFSSAT